MKTFKFALVLLISTYSLTASAWGGRGHNSICESAVFLVKNPELREFLSSRPHIMGHLCNVPDIYWKSLPMETRKSGDPGHYLNSEKIGIKFSEIPQDYKKIVELYTGKPNAQNAAQTLYSVPDEFGSLWWRGDQFYRLALESGKKIKDGQPPKNFKEEQDNESAYNKSVFGMLVNLGLLGHFVGDASQPFHNTSDFDGYAANQGGIHAYYEEAIVAALPGDLEAKIIKQAKAWTSQKFTEKPTVYEKMRALSEVSYLEIKDVLKADRVVKPSTLTIEKGMSLKKPAERRPATENVQNFEKLVIRQLARASYLLAHLWDEAYVQAGKPDLKAYKSYLYPFTPDFVKPDYF
jgi:hypothetical protein